MRFVAVVLMFLGISMIFFFGWKGLTPTCMVCDLEKFFGFSLAKVDCSKCTDKPQSAPTIANAAVAGGQAVTNAGNAAGTGGSIIGQGVQGGIGSFV